MKVPTHALSAVVLSSFFVISGALSCEAQTLHAAVLASVVKIGVISSLDPIGAVWSSSANLGLNQAAKEINDRGGIQGKKIILVFEDDRFDPKQALAAYQKLVDVDQVDFIIGPQFEQTLTPVIPLAARDHRLLITTIGSTPLNSSPFPLVIHSVPPDKLAGKCLADVIRADHRRRVVFVMPQEAYSQTLAGFVKHYLGAVDSEQIDYLSETDDYKPLLLKVRQKKADALVIFFVTPEAAINIYRKMRELELMLPVYSNEVLHNSQILIEQAGSLAAGTVYCGTPFDERNGAFKNFMRALPQRPHLPLYAVVAYDTLNWLAALIEKHGTDQSAVQRAIFSQAYQGLLTTYTFDDLGDLSYTDFVAYEVTRGGFRIREGG